MSNYTDDLLAGLSDDLAKQLEIFIAELGLLDMSEDKKHHLISLFNEAYLEGCHSVNPKWKNELDKSIADESKKFMDNFNSMLTDGSNDRSDKEPAKDS